MALHEAAVSTPILQAGEVTLTHLDPVSHYVNYVRV